MPSSTPATPREACGFNDTARADELLKGIVGRRSIIKRLVEGPKRHAKKKPGMTPEEQSEQFKHEAQRLIDAGELTLIEAERALDKLEKG